MTDANTLRRLNWLWKWRHKHETEVALKSDLLFLKETVETEADAEPGTGAYVHLVSDDAQTVSVGGEAVEWDRYNNLITAFEFVVASFSATGITIPVAGYYNVAVTAEWDTHTAGGSVWVTRTSTGLPAVTVWPPAEDPGIWTATNGQRGSWEAPAIPFKAGDVMTVHIDHDAASTKDLSSATLAVYLVEGYIGAHVAGVCPTLGTSNIISTADHDAFPGFCVAQDGTHIIVYREGDGHTSNDGVLKQRTSTDGGTTWSSATTIVTDASYDFRGASLSVMTSGRIVLVAEARDNAGADITDGGFTLYSDDEGGTWSSKVQVDDSFTDWSRAVGPVLELSSGSWLLPVYGADSGYTSPRTSVRVITSADNGSTWSATAEPADGQTDLLGYNEAGMVRTGTTIVLFIRAEGDGHSYGHEFFRTVSVDDGATWTTVTAVMTEVGGAPKPFLRANGDIAIQLRDTSATPSVPPHLYRSSDLGETWTDCGALTNTNAGNVYGQPWEDANGKLGIAYADEIDNTSSADCELYFVKEL